MTILGMAITFSNRHEAPSWRVGTSVHFKGNRRAKDGPAGASIAGSRSCERAERDRVVVYSK
jgi:hypothetical protein